jgi:hypothetical protein
MPKQDGAGLRARIPAAVASATAATIAQATRWLEKAQQAVPLRRAKQSETDSPTRREDDTH